MPDSLEVQLSGLGRDLKRYTENTQSKMAEMQRQLDALDITIAGRIATGGNSVSSIEETLRENEQIERLLRDKRGTAHIKLGAKELGELQRKTVITATAAGAGLAPVGLATTGVLPIERIPGIVPERARRLQSATCCSPAPRLPRSAILFAS